MRDYTYHDEKYKSCVDSRYWSSLESLGSAQDAGKRSGLSKQEDPEDSQGHRSVDSSVQAAAVDGRSWVSRQQQQTEESS